DEASSALASERKALRRLSASASSRALRAKSMSRIRSNGCSGWTSRKRRRSSPPPADRAKASQLKRSAVPLAEKLPGDGSTLPAHWERKPRTSSGRSQKDAKSCSRSAALGTPSNPLAAVLAASIRPPDDSIRNPSGRFRVSASNSAFTLCLLLQRGARQMTLAGWRCLLITTAARDKPPSARRAATRDRAFPALGQAAVVQAAAR